MNTLIKICGITNAQDARAAVDAGAQALGFNFYEPSPRYIAPHLAREIIDLLPPFVTTVAVLVNHTVEATKRLLESVPLNLLQLHGDESPELCDSYGFPYIKAIRARSVAGACRDLHRYPNARAFLFDTLVNDMYGGTGEPFAWQPLPDWVAKPVILAGGLSAGNVVSAIRTVRPYAVDVSSGVEVSKGKKDLTRVRRFTEAVRLADSEQIDLQEEKRI